MPEQLGSKPPEAEGSSVIEAEELRLFERLKYSKGKMAFYRYFLRRFKERKAWVDNKLGFHAEEQLVKWAAEMKAMADKAKERWPEAAQAISAVRKRIEGLLERIKEEEKQEKKKRE